MVTNQEKRALWGQDQDLPIIKILMEAHQKLVVVLPVEHYKKAVLDADLNIISAIQMYRDEVRTRKIQDDMFGNLLNKFSMDCTAGQ